MYLILVYKTLIPETIVKNFAADCVVLGSLESQLIKLILYFVEDKL